MDKISLGCRACKSTNTMYLTKVGRFSRKMQITGMVIYILTLVVISISVYVMLDTVYGMARIIKTEAEALVITGTVRTCIVSMIISIVAWIIGRIMILKKKVFKCVKCGHIIDRG